MVEFKASHAVLGAAVAWGVTRQLDKQAAKASEDNGEQPAGTEPTMDSEELAAVEEQLADLYGLERRQRGGQDAIDGYVGTTISDLSPGATATVRITPTAGHELMVKSLVFDRRSDHEYEFLIGGNRRSENHQVRLQAPRRVQRGKPVLAKVTNNSGSSSSFDFEGEMWGIPTANGMGRR